MFTSLLIVTTAHSHYVVFFFTVDLSSWEQKIQRDAVAERLYGEQADEGADSVLMEHQSDSAMEMSSPTQELYKDGVLTLGCIGKLLVCFCIDNQYHEVPKKLTILV